MLQQDNLILLRQRALEEHVPIISKETETLLFSLLLKYRPMNILEVGTGIGYSSIVMALALPECKITTLELIEKRRDAALKNFEEFKLQDRIKLIYGDARKTIKDLNKGYDFVFIDSAKSHYKEFFDNACALTNKDALIVCDNVFLGGRTISDSYIKKHREKTSALKMRKFLKYIQDYKEINTEILEIGDGVAVCKLGNLR